MKLLLDTHTLVWFFTNDAKLSAIGRSAILDPANQSYISPVAYWELAIKLSLGKLKLAVPFQTFIDQVDRHGGVYLTPIEARHAAMIVSLPHHHRDPFDRMLVAQAIVERMAVVSSDNALDAYGVTRIW